MKFAIDTIFFFTWISITMVALGLESVESIIVWIIATVLMMHRILTEEDYE